MSLDYAVERLAVNAQQARRRLLDVARVGEHTRGVAPLYVGQRRPPHLPRAENCSWLWAVVADAHAEALCRTSAGCIGHTNAHYAPDEKTRVETEAAFSGGGLL